MLLSIIILSYNRPLQIQRILEKISFTTNKNFELIIKDDSSPKFDLIYDIFTTFKENSSLNLRLYKNNENLGYDLNLLSAFSIARSDYVFLLSDDDFIEGSEINNLISFIEKSQLDFYFTPYTDGIQINRKPHPKGINQNKSSIIYNSILFSGLIFNKSKFFSLDIDTKFLDGCIYSQVYIVCMLYNRGASFDFAPTGVLYLGGDGKNYFGLNKAAKNSVLKDRKSVYANLRYQEHLIEVVKKVNSISKLDWLSCFLKEYKKRLIAYCLLSRSKGINQYLRFLFAYFNSEIPKMTLPILVMALLFFLPSSLAKIIYLKCKTILRSSG